MKSRCCPNTPNRKIARSVHESARDVARDIAKTDAYKQSRRDRKKVEVLFAHLKRILKLDRLRLRGPSGAHDEFLLAATAQNLRRMAKWLCPVDQEMARMAIWIGAEKHRRYKIGRRYSPILSPPSDRDNKVPLKRRVLQQNRSLAVFCAVADCGLSDAHGRHRAVRRTMRTISSAEHAASWSQREGGTLQSSRQLPMQRRCTLRLRIWPASHTIGRVPAQEHARQETL